MKLDDDTVTTAGNTLLREYALDILPEQVEIVVDFPCDRTTATKTTPTTSTTAKPSEELQCELSEGWSREIDHELRTEFDGHEWTVKFPVMIDCTYKQGRYDEHGVATPLVVAV